jgi:pimeloyl-ACP methyl ester carboxylesterase
VIRLKQAEFTTPNDAHALLEHPLVVHQHAETASDDKLVIFVHGLGGSRYGEKSTWGNFPRFLFEDIAELDIGMYQYRTLTARLGFEKSIPLEEEARVFADMVRDQLAQYNNIVLIGHSMGGLLCKAMIHRLLESGDQDSLARIGGLILMATPQLGSLRVPGFLGFLSFDARALGPHSELVSRINRAFEDHVALDEGVSTLRKTTIPTWAVEAISDRWVDPLSAGIGLVSSRRKVVRGSHTSIVKPSTRDSDVYPWVKDRIKTSLSRFKYDVFVAAAMAAHDDDAEYKANHEAVLSLIETLKTKCNCKAVFYAGKNMSSMEKFDPEELALKDDLAALRKSRNFMLFYPKKIVSSVLYEAGWALILGKPSIYIVRSYDDLPFLMKEAQQAFSHRRVRIFECRDHESVLDKVAGYGDRLFQIKVDDGAH